jgi:RNA polymerase sigma factor (sigma-70 family)
MGDAPVTRPSLLVRIRDGQDQQAWSQFVEIYAPLIYGFARNHGLQDADAADLAQEVLRSVLRGARRLEYDPKRGSFRGWLFTVVRNKLRTFVARRASKGNPQGTGDTGAHELLQQQPAPEEEAETLWRQEYERRLFAWAAEQVRGQVQESTWQAFWQTAVDGKGGKEVATNLGMTVAAVYLCKGRVMAKLKEQIRQARGEENED